MFLVHGWAQVRRPAAVAAVCGGNKMLGLATTGGWRSAPRGRGDTSSVHSNIYGSLAMIVIMLGAIYYKLFKWKVPSPLLRARAGVDLLSSQEH